MRTRGRLGRSAIAASALLATIGVPGLAPKIAAADPHNRTAPYDFGERCQSLPGQELYLCNPDPVAMTTGAVDGVTVLPGVVLCPPCLPHFGEETSTVGIFFDVGAPGTLTVTAAADVVGIGSLCLRVASRLDCRGPGGVRDLGAGPVNLQVVREVNAGHYWAYVHPQSFCCGSGENLAAIVKMISYEVT